jgi:ADP-ribose pyrophosphatase YjhB (NUDIX family)
MTHQVKLITTATVIAGDDVLFVKYADMPDHQRGWFMPHDLLEPLEHPHDGARRALRDQLGIEIDSMPLKQIESFRGRDGTWHMSFHHLLELPERRDVRTSAAIASARWFKRSELPSRDEVAHHGWAVDVLSLSLEGRG